MLSVEGATYFYRPIDGFARARFLKMLSVAGAIYIYRLIDDFAKIEFAMVF